MGNTKTESGKNVGLIVYILQGAAFFSGFTVFMGIIINYVKMSEVRGTWLESHFRWQISTFWWGFVLWPLIGIVAFFTTTPFAFYSDLIYFLEIILPFLIFFIDIIWVIYRIVKGLILLSKEKEI